MAQLSLIAASRSASDRKLWLRARIRREPLNRAFPHRPIHQLNAYLVTENLGRQIWDQRRTNQASFPASAQEYIAEKINRSMPAHLTAMLKDDRLTSDQLSAIVNLSLTTGD